MPTETQYESISKPDELLAVLQDNYKADYRFYLKLAIPFYAVIAIGIIFNIVFYFGKNDFGSFLLSVVPATAGIGIILFILTRKFKPKKPTIEDAKKWYVEKMKAVAVENAINTSWRDHNFSSGDGQQNFEQKPEIESFRDERPLIGDIKQIVTTSIENLKVMEGLAQRAVIVSTSQREVDRVTTNIVDGTLFIHRIALVRGNQTFHGHVKNVIGNNYGDITINKPSRVEKMNFSGDYVEIYLPDPEAIKITKN
jgi:hypothetical protein